MAERTHQDGLQVRNSDSFLYERMLGQLAAAWGQRSAPVHVQDKRSFRTGSECGG